MMGLGMVLAPVRGAVAVVTALPKVVEAVLVLPTLVEQLGRVNDNTDSLPDILDQLRSVQADTKSLPLVHEELAAMRLIVAQVEQNTLAVERLAETVLPLQGAAARVGRFADRLPQRRFERSNGNGRLAPERHAADYQADAR
jgi:hypothetical protein